jgi:hypothetical protein
MQLVPKCESFCDAEGSHRDFDPHGGGTIKQDIATRIAIRVSDAHILHIRHIMTEVLRPRLHC